MNNPKQISELLCRACMCENQIFHSLCDVSEDKSLTIYEMLATTIPQVPIHSNDELPKKICEACLNTLIIVHKFQQMCIASDTYMRSLLVSNRLTSHSINSDITEQQEEIKHKVMAQETKLVTPHVTQEPHQSPLSVKVEANDEGVNESVLEPIGCYQENDSTDPQWSNGDDIDANSPWNYDFRNRRYHTKSTSTVSKAEQQQLNETDSYEIEKPNSSSHLQYNFPCPHCDAVFCSNCKLKQHSLLHDETRPFVCDVCNYRYETSKTLLHHKYTHKTTPPDGFKCSKCPRRFEKQSSLSAHMRTHREHKTDVYEIEKPYSRSYLQYNFACPHCDATFRSESSLKRHSPQHDETRPFVCEVCNYRFETSTNLLHHKKTHEMTPPGGFKCPKCPRRFEKQISIVPHMRKHRENLFNCDLCPKIFRKMTSLADHLRQHEFQKFMMEDGNENKNADFEAKRTANKF